MEIEYECKYPCVERATKISIFCCRIALFTRVLLLRPLDSTNEFWPPAVSRSGIQLFARGLLCQLPGYHFWKKVQ
ncbi:unnamed protein product [Blepharisma stoltei]|uniref:Uncharacterized protein n=1 Tax=Blepharisma stoltei TaxID=1481888 RepID=A0AAU9IHU7_9CILI|nr:unnamed protein product [Blepharisma stoltei]